MANKKSKAKAKEVIMLEFNAFMKDRDRNHLQKIQEMVNILDHAFVVQVKVKDEVPYHLKFFPEAKEEIEEAIAEKK